MSEETLQQVPPSGFSQEAASLGQSKMKEFLWSLPQPFLVLGSMLAVATAYSYGWTDPDLFATIMIVLPLPTLIIAERIWTKRKDWIPNAKEMAEDAFWLACAMFIWFPLYSDYYRTPISDGFEWIREISAVPFSLQPQSTLGLIFCAILVRTLSEFIYYWLHRVQHESLFWWRIHATHHHITKMSAARADRTHPLEFLALLLGTPIVLALCDASDGVIAVAGAFGFWSAYVNHSNLPLRSGIYGWFFTTAEIHQRHHSLVMEESNSNYGCTIIIWDRLFGSFSGSKEVKAIGAGTGKALSIPMQFALAFLPSEKLTKL